MESVGATKPPWVVAQKSGWQPRRRFAAVPSLTYGPWKGDVPRDLLEAKQEILPLERSHQWELVKKMANPYELIFTQEDDRFHPSLSLFKPLSRSYFKLVEMLAVLQFFDRLPKQLPKLRTAHIAEGPGGFIQAVIDLAQNHRRQVAQATAMTLKPTDHRVPGWRRAANFLNRHREVKLHYGVDGTGDIYQRGNQESFSATATPTVHLYTADGGFDFSINYDIQEQRVFHLLVCSATIGIECLSTDGSMVIKLFDAYSESTQILMLLLGRCFKEWMVYKPATSRPCNSERYFLGREFRGKSPETVRLLLEIQERSLRGEFPSGLESFAAAEDIAYFQALAADSTASQLAALARAKVFVNTPEAWYTDQLPKDFETSRVWCQTFRIPTEIRAPLPIKSPVQAPLCDTSRTDAAPQSQTPDADSDCRLPSDRA
jgi:23S rRNA U2552 (ribose-2'-O)-methylase RlmE/FtsJ